MVKKTSQHTKTYNLTHDTFKSQLITIKSHILRSKRKYEEIYAIPRGGFILAVYLSHQLNIPMRNGIKGPNTLIVDDICDTGETLQSYNQDKVVLVGKPKGVSRVKKLFCAHMVSDETWIVFDWEVEDV